MPKFDGSLLEAMNLEQVPIPPKSVEAQIEPKVLECEKRVSFDLNDEANGTTNLVDPSVHAFPARIVARVRKRPYSIAQRGALNRKRLKTFVTDNKGKAIATGFHREQHVRNETTDEINSSSKQKIYGAN